MRVAIAVGVMLAMPAAAWACPPFGDNGASPCTTESDEAIAHVRHAVETALVAAVTGTAVVDGGDGDGLIDASVAAGLRYSVRFGDLAAPTRELAVALGVNAHRFGGAVGATGLATHAEVQLGPAIVATGDDDNKRTNLAMFPRSFELVHDGELAALPSLSARLDLRRGLYSRERALLTTRLLRLEGEASQVRHDEAAGPGARGTRSTALDLVPLHAGVDATAQGGLRIASTLGGALFGVSGHRAEQGARFEALGAEHEDIQLPDRAVRAIDTFWWLRLEVTNPQTGTRYFAGVGTVIDLPHKDEVTRLLGREDRQLTVGGLGWWHDRAWGGVGWQYRREPYITMAGEVAIEDRMTAEVYHLGSVAQVARVFVAQVGHQVGEIWQKERTVGLETDFSTRVRGVDLTIAFEGGRSLYGAIDDAAPALGYTGRFSLTAQYRKDTRWMR